MRPIYYINSDLTQTSASRQWAEGIAKAMNFEAKECFIMPETGEGATLSQWEQLPQLIENDDVAMIVLERKNDRCIQPLLNYCRELRVPYLMIKPGTPFNVAKVAVPITFLMEEKEKAPFASAFGRFCKSELIIFSPNDYGSKAKINIAATKKLFDTFSLTYTEQQGKKDSNGIEREVASIASEQNIDLEIVTASREYGLDDILFGCKEKKILKKYSVPILLLNPRGDLYSLCD